MYIRMCICVMYVSEGVCACVHACVREYKQSTCTCVYSVYM